MKEKISLLNVKLGLSFSEREKDIYVNKVDFENLVTKNQDKEWIKNYFKNYFIYKDTLEYAFPTSFFFIWKAKGRKTNKLYFKFRSEEIKERIYNGKLKSKKNNEINKNNTDIFDENFNLIENYIKNFSKLVTHFFDVIDFSKKSCDIRLHNFEKNLTLNKYVEYINSFFKDIKKNTFFQKIYVVNTKLINSTIKNSKIDSIKEESFIENSKVINSNLKTNKIEIISSKIKNTRNKRNLLEGKQVIKNYILKSSVIENYCFSSEEFNPKINLIKSSKLSSIENSTIQDSYISFTKINTEKTEMLNSKIVGNRIDFNIKGKTQNIENYEINFSSVTNISFIGNKKDENKYFIKKSKLYSLNESDFKNTNVKYSSVETNNSFNVENSNISRTRSNWILKDEKQTIKDYSINMSNIKNVSLTSDKFENIEEISHSVETANNIIDKSLGKISPDIINKSLNLIGDEKKSVENVLKYSSIKSFNASNIDNSYISRIKFDTNKLKISGSKLINIKGNWYSPNGVQNIINYSLSDIKIKK